jgi:2-keto-4-pentenoate hydratase/2-oxohepta-3-ene-1,7-dioic acid hydratase in catechol pathway
LGCIDGDRAAKKSILGDETLIVRFRNGEYVLTGKLNGEIIESEGHKYYLGEVELLAPTEPSKVICIGLNYTEHARELKMAIPDEPIIFLKPPSSVIGPEEDITLPPSSDRVDFEGELAVVIGKRCKNISANEAERYILGYTCFNDVTARDLQQKDGQWTRAKSFDTFAPIGPYIAQIDPFNVDITTRVNGVIRQSSNTSDLIFNVPTLVEFISHIMTLTPGDVIATGTPPGVGALKEGDLVEVGIEGIGVLKNRATKPS